MSENNQKSDDFFKLFMKNQKVVYAYILSMVHNCSDADDIMQETMTLMWERFGEFTPGTNFGAWATRIARYKILNMYKNKRRSTEKFDESLMDQISDCYHQKMNDMSYRLAALQDCLKKLNTRDRKLIEILYEEGVKIAELARRLNRPVQGLYKVMARIHTALRRCVDHKIRKWDLS